MNSTLVESVFLRNLERVSRSKAWSLARGFDCRCEAIERDRSQEQSERLADLVQCAAGIDFWRERLTSRSKLVSPSYKELFLPVGKSELEAAFPEKAINPATPVQDLRFAATRGTTQRMICVHDFAKRDAIRAANIVTLRASGYRLGMRMVEIPPDICDVVCGEQGEREEGVLRHLLGMLRLNLWRNPNAYRDLRGLVERNWVYNRRTYPPFGAGGSHPGQTRLDYYIGRLQRDKPFLLKGLTTYLYQIAQRVLERGDVDLAIPVIKPLGSGATPSMRETLELAFGGRFWDDYGSAELGSVAFACGQSDGMHVIEDLFVVEVLDEQGEPTAPGEIGEVVVTDLMNHAMPLIRYRVGDLGRLLESSCPCGRSSRRLSIEGRLQDALRDRHGRWVSSNEIAEHMYQLPWVDQFQLVERREDLLELTVVLSNGRQPDQSQLSAFFCKRLGRNVRLRMRTAKSIGPEPGGKFRWVKALPPKPVASAGAVTSG